MEGSGGVVPPLLLSALAGSEWSPSRLSRFPPEGRAPSTHCARGCVGPRADLDAVLLPLPGIVPQPSSPSLYRLSYPGFPPVNPNFRETRDIQPGHSGIWDCTLLTCTPQQGTLQCNFMLKLELFT
jgi:hypothetical protein